MQKDKQSRVQLAVLPHFDIIPDPDPAFKTFRNNKEKEKATYTIIARSSVFDGHVGYH